LTQIDLTIKFIVIIKELQFIEVSIRHIWLGAE